MSWLRTKMFPRPNKILWLTNFSTLFWLVRFERMSKFYMCQDCLPDGNGSFALHLANFQVCHLNCAILVSNSKIKAPKSDFSWNCFNIEILSWARPNYFLECLRDQVLLSGGFNLGYLRPQTESLWACNFKFTEAK